MDHVHLVTDGYRQLGEKYGQIYFERVVLGHDWQPLAPTTIERSGPRTITVHFHVPVPPLVWETTFTPPHQSSPEWQAGNGFEPVLSAATKNLGNKVEIRIRDNGTGIPLEVKEKMFNPFFTTKPAGEGTGLGLSMSHDIIVKQHGGTIDVETEPGLFTELKIVLPRTRQS